MGVARVAEAEGQPVKGAQPEPSGGRRTIEPIAALRGCAALLVVWDHLAAEWPDRHGQRWLPVTEVRRWVNNPFGVIQDFGWLGVAIFFLVSGFIITHVAQRETRLQFGLKRVFRIYPPLWCSLALIVLVEWLRSSTHIGGAVGGLSIGRVAGAGTLLNYFAEDQGVVNGVAWTLVIEVLFYTLTFALLPLVRSRPHVAMAANLVVVGSIIHWRYMFGNSPSWFLLAVCTSYLPILLLGQAVYYRWSHRIGTRALVVLSAAAVLEFVYAVNHVLTQFDTPGNSYGVSVVYAYAIFVGALVAGSRIPFPRPLRLASNVSYSLYLLHGTVGFLVLDLVAPRLPLTLSLLTAMAASFLTAWISWRFVEKPSQRLARAIGDRLNSLWRRRTPA